MARWPLLKTREPAAQQTGKDRLSAGLSEAPLNSPSKLQLAPLLP